MKTAYNHLTHSYETPDKTTVAAEICEGDSPSDAFRAAAIREQQRKSAAYVRTVIEALYENSDPVSVEAAELLERMTQPEPEPEPVAWMDRHGDLYKKLPSDDWHPPHTPLYTSPPKRKPLTDDEFISMVDSAGLVVDPTLAFEIKEMVEDAHGIKE